MTEEHVCWAFRPSLVGTSETSDTRFWPLECVQCGRVVHSVKLEEK